MELGNFKEYLSDKKLDRDKIDAAVKIIDEFNEFLLEQKKSGENITYDDLHNFSSYLIENKKNTLDNYVFLLRFGYFKKNYQLIIASMELIDGSEIIPNFSKMLIDKFGEQVRNEIFGELEIPPLGLHPKKKSEITMKLMERLIAKVEEEECIEFLSIGLRDKYTDSYKRPRETFLKTNNIDDFLNTKRQNFLQTLKKHQQEGTLFFTQEIDDNVISYVNSDLTIEAGVREGNQVIISKIPYMTKQYLETDETDVRRKKYYFCHNPWIREALLDKNQPVSPIICHSSGGYYKNYWEAVLDHPVKVELLESVIKGDKVCKFALHLPEEK
ncbi:MAG: hypothetical protein ACXAC7_21435 [Candidatus Hodarchaeales archaeon]|jgi:hypothetical protein